MPTAEISLPDEFTSSMQKLVAEAEKNVLPAKAGEQAVAGVRNDLATLEERMTGLAKAMEAGFKKIAAAVAAKDGDMPAQIERMDENLRSLRNTESVNQRLFNSLHEELRSYRDDFLRDALQKPMVRDLIVLLDDLRAVAESVPPFSAETGEPPWRENLDNTTHTLVEILHRLEVDEIEAAPKVDRSIHRVASCEVTDVKADDGLIVKRLKRGFTWRGQVLRPEEVVAKRFEQSA